jgi:hypothetical protein
MFNCNWVATLWQQYSTHLHTNNTQNNRNKNRVALGGNSMQVKGQTGGFLFKRQGGYGFESCWKK